MGFSFGKIKNGILAQVNPFDGGKTWSNPQGASPQPQMQPGTGPGIYKPPAVYNQPVPEFAPPVKQAPTYLPDSFKGFSKGLDDVSFKVGQAQNNLRQAAGRGITGLVEAINPYDNESKGNQLIDSTVSTYGVTPELKRAMDNTNPYVVDPNTLDSRGLTNNRAAAGTYTLRRPGDNLQSRLSVTNSTGAMDKKSIMFHEGLHAAYDTSPQQDREKFLDIIQRVIPQGVVTPPLRKNDTRSWLEQRVAGYRDPNHDMSDFKALSPGMQTEVHSYLPEYYENYGRPMPAELSQYYSKYYTPGRMMQRDRMVNEIANAVPSTLDYRFKGER
jgi:hypothetical protein